MPLLALSNVIADYGQQRILGPLSLELVRGQKVALVGKSGAGKSTLLGLMYQQWQQHSDVALMPQELGLVPSLSVFHNVFIGGLARHSSWYNLASLIRPFRRDIAAITPLLEQLKIAEKCWSPSGELSGGERQRVAAARALYQKKEYQKRAYQKEECQTGECQQGELLLADEPASALDGPMAELVMAALTQGYSTAVLAMHDVDLALRFTDRVLGICDGEIAVDAPSHQLRAQDLLVLY